MLLSGVQNLAVDIAGEKGDGKIGMVLVTGTMQAALLMLVANFVLKIDLPTDPDTWLTFAWVLLFGVITCAYPGIALSALPRAGKSATAVVIPIVLILQFISGVYLQFNLLPDWMQNLVSLVPRRGARARGRGRRAWAPAAE